MYKTTKCRRADSLTNKIKSAVMLLMLFVSFGSYAQYCEVSTDWTSDYLSSITISNALQNISYTATSQPAGSYADQTDQVIMQSQGLSFDISTTFVGGSNGVNVWIDFDGDEEFDDSEKVFSENGANDHSGTINIPIVVAIGEYRMRVRGQWGSAANPPPCGSVNYGSTVDFTLSVVEAPDCMPPSGITATPTSLTTVELSWEEGDGIGYDLEWGEAGFDQGDGTLIEDLTNTSTEVTVVTDTEYEFYVRQDCGPDGYSMWVGPFSFETGYCDPVYQYGCSNGAKISNFEITNAILNLTNNTGTASCGTNGYNDFTSMSASAPADFEVSYSVTVGSYSAGVKLWVDWNNNGEFEADELMGESATTITSGNSFTGNFTVPAGTPLGDYRIRARVVESTTTFDPCSQHNYGETEDYTFTVIEAPDCMPPTGIAATPTSLTAVELSWNEGDGIGYEVEWGEAGFDQGDGTLIEDLTVTSTEVTVVTDTEYQFYVRQDCGIDGYSLWAGPYSFQTGYCDPVYQFGCSNGSKISNFEITDAILNLANNTGTATCGTNGYNDFTSISASAPAEYEVAYSVTVGSYSGGVKLWIDWNNNGEFETDELMGQSTTTITSGNSFTGNFIVPAGTPMGDYRIRARVVESTTTFDPCSQHNYGETEDYTFIVIEAPDCMPPTELGATIETMTEADLFWTSDGDLFDIEWGEAGFDQGDGTTVTDIDETTYSLDNLTPDTEYEFYVRQDCGTSDSLWAGPFLFFTGYCDVSTSNTGDYISAFSTENAFTNVTYAATSQPSGSYSNETTPPITQSAGLTFDFSSTYVGGSNGVNIWIDYNNDLEFEESEKVFSLANANATKTGAITIPVDTPVGEYRMRVRAQWGSTVNPPACGNVNYGSTLDFTLNVVEPPACMPPAEVNIVQVTDDSLEVGWTAPAEQDAWQVLALPAGSPAPDDTTTGWTATTENPFTVEGLDPATEYDVYVRANCGEDDGLSMWAGPASAMTTQIATEVDFEDDFEGSSGWTFTNESQTNQWHVGTATSYQGGSSLYISNNNGTSNSYSTTSSATVTHAIRDLAFPDNTNEATIGFYWKAVGESCCDYMRVYLMPSTFQPVAGTQINNTVGGIQLGGNFNTQAEWQQYFELLDLSQFAGQTGRLIFEWRNDGSVGTQPPAAVDNVEVKLITCSRPIEVIVEKNQVTGNLLASWTPVAGETQWEVIVQASDEPAPDETSTGVIVNQPQYLLEDVVEGEFYKIYVRAICSDDDKSLWTDGVAFSDFNPPACANIDLELPELNIDEQGDFIFCESTGELTLDLVAEFDDSMFKSTTSYEVEQIEFLPPFPTTGGIEMDINVDDTFSPDIELPFPFCFYGQNFTTAQVSSNGVVHLGGGHVPGSPWTLTAYNAFPDPTYLVGNGNKLRNVIMGVFQDINPSITSTDAVPNINYQILGTYPCRALVVSFSDVPLYSSSCYALGGQTYQIVMYEITNIIEVYVYKRDSCSSFNSGKGVIGLINEDHTAGTFPPGRNIGTWEAQEEAWRFTPSGETNVEFGWYVNGEFYSDNPNDQITITEDTCIEARVSYPGCGGEDLVLSKEYCVKVAPEITLDKPDDIKVCVVDGEYEPINLTDKIPEVIEALAQTDNFNLADYEFTFYLSETAADAKTNPIANPEGHVPSDLSQTIWIRVEHISTGCYSLTSFVIYEGIGLDLIRPDNITLCVYHDIIPETDLSRVNGQLLGNIDDTDGLIVNYYHSQQDAVFGNNPIQDWANFEAPTLPYEVWIKVSGSEEICESITSFRLLEGIGLPEYEHPNFDICTGYVLPKLPDGYFYTTEYLAEGNIIQPGTVIEEQGVHTIYVNIISDEGCITSSSYNVNVIECTVPRGVSPNGDGLNDNFDLSDYFLVDLKIFNRDGREVYSHGMGYTNEWEGQSNSGNLLPDGTYYYRIVTPVEELTGWVQLARETK